MATNPRVPFELSSDRPKYKAPKKGKNLIVQVVVNVENWRFDQPMPRKLLSAPHGADSLPDVPNFSWAEYGQRCGMPRILEALDDRGIIAGCTINAAVIESYPRLAEEILKAGWEFMGHGLHQKSLQASGADEATVIGTALNILRKYTGKPVYGWLGPGLRQTDNTPDILKAEGLRYVSDWVLDDLPTWMTTKHGPFITMPYSIEINDSVLHAAHQYESDVLYRRMMYTLQTFDRGELKENPRVLTIALHPHLIGVPHRMIHLHKMLDVLQKRKDTIFMTGVQIADWWESVSPPPKKIKL